MAQLIHSILKAKSITYIIELICSLGQTSPKKEVKAMYSSYIIKVFGSTDPFYNKNKVNTMHNECIIEHIC